MCEGGAPLSPNVGVAKASRGEAIKVAAAIAWKRREIRHACSKVESLVVWPPIDRAGCRRGRA